MDIAGAQHSTWLPGRKVLLLSSGRDFVMCQQMSNLSGVAGRDRLCKAEAVSLKVNVMYTV